MGWKPMVREGVEVVMAERDLSGIEPRRLAELMAVEADAVWTADELGEVLRHQLAVPLGAELPEMEKSGGMTFGELLRHASPPVELLERVKAFAKSCRGGGALPTEVADVLYFAAIGVAALRCGRSITTLRPESIERGLGWAAERAWVEAPMRKLLTEALAAARAGTP